MKRVFLVLLAAGLVQAQSVVVTPANESTGVGLTRQYTATVSGLSGTGVTWSANAGTISATGLYTAPAVVPGQNPAQITAISTADGKTSGVVYANILTTGPTISSVSPNPIPSGSSNVTVTGVGFVPGAMIWNNGVQLSTTFVNSTTLKAGVWLAAAKSTYFYVRNPGSTFSAMLLIPMSGASSGGGGGGGGGGGSSAPVIAPKSLTLVLGGTQQFSAPGATSWTAVSGSVTSAGFYTAPTAMPASGADTVAAINATGQSASVVSLVSNIPPTLTSIGTNPLPLGVFSTTVTGTGFVAGSVAQLNGLALSTAYGGPTTLTVTGFAGAGGTVNLTVANGPVVSQPLAVPVGVQNPLASASAARRFLEQAAFGPTPNDAAHVQTIGIPAWINEQLAMPVISNYNAVVGSQSGLPATFLANAVTNPDQLRQRVAFALSQIFVTSITKLIWNGDMIPYQQMLIGDAFTNYRQILGDVTLSPGMGEYLDMANNAKANPNAGTAANENYAREIMQLFSIGTKLLNQDGSAQVDVNGPIPSYNQTNVTELARVFTGWTYAPPPGKQPTWPTYINSAGPMVPYPAMHDAGSKTLLNGYVAAANLSTQQDMQGALDNLAAHPNVAPFISKQLIQHLVKSNPTPAYVQRVALAFTQSNGDMQTVISTILLDQEARASDEGGNDLSTDGHLQEPALFVPGFVRAFGGQMTNANYYASDLRNMGEDIYNPASVFNYFSPSYTVGGTGGLQGPEFQIYNANASILRENLVAQFFNQYSNPVQSNGPGTIVDLTAFLPLASTPATLVNALDLTLTHGTMPAAMKQTIVTAVTADTNGNLKRVQTAVYLILTSSYYSVWH